MTRHLVIIGGGITGLSALEHATREAPDLRVTLLESSPRLGGHIRTDRLDDFVMEAGPDVILTSKPAAIELAKRVGLGERLQGTNPGVRGSYILSGGRLRRVPDGLTGLVPSRFGPFVVTPVISLLAKARVGLEFFIPPRRDDGDESIEQFVVRRMGRSMYESLVEPLLSGISAGDGSRLSIKAMFPQLRALEREHGGLVRGMLARKRAERKQPKRAPAGGAASAFASFPGGLEELVHGVVRTVQQRGGWGDRVAVRTSVGVDRIDRDSAGGYTVSLPTGERLDADAVIVATPAYAAASMLADGAPSLARKLSAIEYASTVTLSLVYEAADVPRPLDATGYVIPKREGRAVLACTWTSAKFTGRAPEGRKLFRLFLGGAGRGGQESLSAEALLAIAAEEMRDVLGITAAPVFARINRFDRALPQYTVGHTDRMAAIAADAATLPGLELAGAVYRGIGIPDCVQSGVDAAARTLAFIATASSTPTASLT